MEERFDTELQKQLMNLADEIINLGVPNALLSKFERIAIQRYEEMRRKKNTVIKHGKETENLENVTI